MIESNQVKVAIATYKRNALLSELLESLASASVLSPFSVIVVDNDPQGEARSSCNRDDLAIEYVHEPSPGIAAARNCALRSLKDDDKAIVFVDDDEIVDSMWMVNLLGTMNKLSADVVSGPVVSVFPDNAPPWIIRGNFHQRVRFDTETTISSAATNNTILRTEFLKNLDSPWFDESFSMTGGSDTEFFSRVKDAGAVMAWCDEAVVWERVPTDRLSLAWIWRRGVRIGNVTGRLKLRRERKARVLNGALIRIAYGLALSLKSAVLGKGLQSRDLDYVVRGIGWIGAITNNLVQEYERPTDASTSQGKSEKPRVKR